MEQIQSTKQKEFVTGMIAGFKIVLVDLGKVQVLLLPPKIRVANGPKRGKEGKDYRIYLDYILDQNGAYIGSRSERQ